MITGSRGDNQPFVAVILKPIEVPALDGLLGLHDAFKPNLIVYNNLKMGTARALYDLRDSALNAWEAVAPRPRRGRVSEWRCLKASCMREIFSNTKQI